MRKKFTPFFLSLVMSLLTTTSIDAQNKNGIPKPSGFPSKLDVPSSALSAPPATPAPTVKTRSATGQARNVTFWVNLEARFIRDAATNEYQYGMYEVTVDKDVLTGSDFKLMGKSHGNMLANQGGVFYDGVFYCCNGEESYGIFSPYVFRYHEANDWGFYMMRDERSPGFVADNVTLNPVTKKAYGTFNTPEGGYDFDLCEVDYSHSERKWLAKAQHRYLAMAVDRAGRCLGVNGLGDLYEINTTNGTETLIGSTGLKVTTYDGAPYYYQSGCFDPASDTFYWARTDMNGKSAIYGIDPKTAKAELLVTLPDYSLITFMMVHESSDALTAPASVTNLQAATEGAGTEATISFRLPQTNVSGGVISGVVSYEIFVDGVTQKQGSATAGTSVSEKLTLTPGPHRIDVIPTNAAGNGVLAFTPAFVGYDKPEIPNKANVLIQSNKATINWSAAVGELGGNVGNVTYTVTRYPDNKVVAESLAATTFTDETLPGGNLVKYSYGIVPSNSTGTGREALINAQTGGDAKEIPFYVKFRTDKEEKEFSFTDANNDDITWEVSSYWDYIRFSHNSFISSSYSMQPSDDWMFLPAISLKAGKRYSLEYDEFGTQGFDLSESLEVKIGRSMSPDAQEQTIAPKYVIPKATQQHRTFEFTVSTDGNYHIGFHACGAQQPANDIRIQSIAVTEVVGDNAPNAIDNLVITPGEKGAYQATVSFKAPTTTKNGGSLSQISSIRVYRNNTPIHTFNNPSPGESLSFTDTGLTSDDNGVNQYIVVAANSSGDGEVAVSAAYVGVDVPTVEGITGTVHEQNGKLILEWTPVSSVGSGNGYVDPATVTYYLYEQRGARLITIGSVTGQTSYEYDFDVNQGEQRSMKFALGTVNSAGFIENQVADLGSIVVGEPYRLPFQESLEGGARNNNYFFWNETNSSSTPIIATNDSFDDDGGCYQWSGAALGHYYSLNTGKISLKGASSPTAVFAYKFSGRNGSVKVIIETPDGEDHEAKSIEAKDVETGTWLIEKTDLSDYAAYDYIIVKLRMQSDMMARLVKIDAINVLDMPRYNLGIDLNAPAELKAGALANVDIVVRNLGDRDMGDYTVRLYEGDREVFTQTISEELSTLQRQVISARFAPNVFNGGNRTVLKAEVSASRDNNEDDNMREAEVNILKSDAPQPENLTGERQNGGISLNWASPSKLSYEQTEDFESEAFTDFSTGGISIGETSGVLGNGWTLFDGNNTASNKLPDANYINAGARCAWMVFNATTAATSGITPHSGEKVAITFGVTGSKPYDWLISPEMSGQAQTIRFFAKEYAESTNPATIEVLASSTNNSVGTGRDAGYENNTGSFTLLETLTLTSNAWEEFSVALPAGTKYFAIRTAYVTPTGIAAMVDDITYTISLGAVEKYNVYADGQLVATVNSNQMTYAFAQETAQEYAVTAVYANGQESAPVTVTPSTAISNATVPSATDSRYYNLQGQRTDKPTKKGVYIVNGRKIIVK